MVEEAEYGEAPNRGGAYNTTAEFLYCLRTKPHNSDHDPDTLRYLRLGARTSIKTHRINVQR